MPTRWNIQICGGKMNTYNGWTNYETWLMNVNIDNEGIYSMIMENIDNMTANELKEFVSDLCYVKKYNIYHLCDTFSNREFDAVDWSELHESYLSDLEE